MTDHDSILITTRPEAKNFPLKMLPGFSHLNIPLTEIIELKFDSRNFEEFSPDLLIFTSSIGVNLFLDKEISGKYSGVECICIGKATADALSGFTGRVSVPDKMDSSGVIGLLSGGSYKTRRIALLSSRKSNNFIRNFMARNSYNFRVYNLYDALPLKNESILPYASSKDVCAIILTSSQEARVLAEMVDPATCVAKLYAIGNTTYREMLKLGFTVNIRVGNSQIQELANEIMKSHSGEWI